MINVLYGDMLEILPTLEENSFDSCVTDPPYHLQSIVKRFGKKDSAPSQFGTDGVSQRSSKGFMGKEWDGGDIAFRPETWAEVYRVLKPGAFLVAFSGTRTYHRIACAIEDAGFDVRDQLAWMYGTGFPKGLNVFKKVIREVLWQFQNNVPLVIQNSMCTKVNCAEGKESIVVVCAQILPAGKKVLITQIGEEVNLHVQMATWPLEWEQRIGLNTTWSWSNSWEEICEKTSKYITETPSNQIIDSLTWNWLQDLHTSANFTLPNVTRQNGLQLPVITAKETLKDDCTNLKGIPIVTALGSAINNPLLNYKGLNVSLKPAWEPIVLARKPLEEKTIAAQVLTTGTGALNIDACRVDCPGSDKGRWPANLCHDGSDEVLTEFAKYGERKSGNGKPQFTKGIGGKGKVLGGSERSGAMVNTFSDSGTAARFFYSAKANAKDRAGSKHPTVKPVSLMEWLCTLVTQPGGSILDPFAGSGTTGIACKNLGFNCTLIEREKEYIMDIYKRFEEQQEKEREYA